MMISVSIDQTVDVSVAAGVRVIYVAVAVSVVKRLAVVVGAGGSGTFRLHAVLKVDGSKAVRMGGTVTV